MPNKLDVKAEDNKGILILKNTFNVNEELELLYGKNKEFKNSNKSKMIVLELGKNKIVEACDKKR